MSFGITRAPRGHTVGFVLRTFERLNDGSDGSLVNAQGVSVDLIDPAGATLVADGELVYRGEGEFLYSWVTTGLKKGGYKLTFKALMGNGQVAPKDILVELV